jgi:hypothetical protein
LKLPWKPIRKRQLPQAKENLEFGEQKVKQVTYSLRFFPETQNPLEGISGPAHFANRIYIAVTLVFLDASLSPTSLAEQLPSSSVPLLTLDAWVSPLPGHSAWPIALSVRG